MIRGKDYRINGGVFQSSSKVLPKVSAHHIKRFSSQQIDCDACRQRKHHQIRRNISLKQRRCHQPIDAYLDDGLRFHIFSPPFTAFLKALSHIHLSCHGIFHCLSSTFSPLHIFGKALLLTSALLFWLRVTKRSVHLFWHNVNIYSHIFSAYLIMPESYGKTGPQPSSIHRWPVVTAYTQKQPS